MSKVYFPIMYEDVKASVPHPPETYYRVSRGVEHWGDGAPQYVYKIQMVYDGVVAGRKTPSFPDDSEDMEAVLDAMARIKKGKGKRSRGQMTAVGEKPGIPIAEANEILRARSDL